jgi:hypothetical protein
MIISLIRPTMCVLFVKDGKTQLRDYTMVFMNVRKWVKANKRAFRGSPCLVLEDDSIMVTLLGS